MLLKPTKQVFKDNDIIGFDIETYNKNKNFYMGSLVSDYFKKVFYDKRELINELKKQQRYRNVIISATNLGFDFMGLFHGEPEISHFKTLFRGSELITAHTYIEKGDFTAFPKSNKRFKITFIDTMNYARLGVKKLGKILKLPKLEKPACLGRLPKNNKEKEELEIYNIRDSEISMKALRFFYRAFQDLGATPKPTIASTAMSLFKNKYLDKMYFTHKIPDLIDEFKAYYGGRTEAFSRGYIENYYYYDFNSLYPSVMLNRFPDPNTLRTTYRNDTGYIEAFEGMSDVLIYCPYMEYPLLPFRAHNKLYFPYGTFRGWYTHVELRKALKLGYVIKKVYKTLYFKEKCEPFVNFVRDLYTKRKSLKENNDPMQYVVKIIMNSLYGKFGQKFIDRDNWVHEASLSYEQLQEYDFVERIGEYLRIKKTLSRPSSFCFPVWASYVTAYARLKLHDSIISTRPVYCDTDSLITRKRLPESDELGDLKLEMFIDNGIIVKPKFYAFRSEKKDHVKIKGLGVQLSYNEFKAFLDNPMKKYTKFVKFKEAMRRYFIPNEIISIEKNFDLEDNKRIWEKSFNPYDLEASEPVEITKGFLEIGNKSKIPLCRCLASRN